VDARAANGSAARADVFFGEVALADAVAFLVAEGASFGTLSGAEERLRVFVA
jgi:hypothetical protein